MSYCITQMETSFLILKENKKNALKAINEIINYEIGCDSLEEVFSKFYWEVYHLNDDIENDIIGIEFMGVYLLGDFDLFKIIAPFVEDGSYIQMRKEDSTMWRWVFKNKTCTEIKPKIIWE